MTYYDSISEGYIELHKEEQLRKLDIIKKHLPINSKDLLLDIGCGPHFGEFPCKCIGIDPSIELLKLAKIPVVHCRAEALPFADNKFDVVISVTAIQNFDDIKTGLLEAKRVGKERFALSWLKKSPNATHIKRLVEKIFPDSIYIEDHHDIIMIKYKNT